MSTAEYEREPMHEPLNSAPSRIGVLDFGGQYVDLIKKAVERHGYPADILPFTTAAEQLKGTYGALVLSGSPDELMPDEGIWGSMPILGICHGLHCAITAYGGHVGAREVRQDGRIKTNVDTKTALFQGVKEKQTALFTHGKFVNVVPPGFEVIGWHELEDGSEVISAVEGPDNYVGVQFHPEVFDDTPEGFTIFKNFLHDVAGLEPNHEFQDMMVEELIAKKQAEMRLAIGDRPVIALISGGIDSAVALKLAAGVVDPKNLHAFYGTSYLMRDEDDQVPEMLRASGIHVEVIDLSDHFESLTIERDGQTYGPLAETTDPRIQRNIIGKGFIDLVDIVVDRLKLEDPILLQGTNAADRIESGISKGGISTQAIVDHHNLTKEALEKDRNEPLDDLYKDEIRTLGVALGLPDALTKRHPFPGPGLGVRVIEPTIELYRRGLQTEIEQYIRGHTITKRERVVTTPIECRILPVRSAGVGGDERSYHAVVALNQFMRWHDMAEVAHDIPKKFRDDINRVVIALGDRSIRDFTVTDTRLTREAFAQLRHADRVVLEEMRRYGLMDHIQQCPVILLPTSFGESGGRSIVLRPVMTSTYMTVRDMIPGHDLPAHFVLETAERLLTEVEGITQVFIDMTPKPPGRTEWK